MQKNSPALEVPELMLTEKEVAQTLKNSVSVLRKWRCGGRGPAFFRLHDKLIRYSLKDVREWLATQRREPTAKASASLQK